MLPHLEGLHILFKVPNGFCPPVEQVVHSSINVAVTQYMLDIRPQHLSLTAMRQPQAGCQSSLCAT